MKNDKEQALRLIECMPSSATTADIVAEFYFKQKVESGLQDVKNKKTLPHSVFKEKMQKWLKSIGH